MRFSLDRAATSLLTVGVVIGASAAQVAESRPNARVARAMSGLSGVTVYDAVLSADASTILVVGFRTAEEVRTSYHAVALALERSSDWKPQPLELGSSALPKSYQHVETSADGRIAMIDASIWHDREKGTTEQIDLHGAQLALSGGFRGRRLSHDGRHLVDIDIGSSAKPARERSIFLMSRLDTGAWKHKVIASGDRFVECGEPAIDASGRAIVFTAAIGDGKREAGTVRAVYLWRAEQDTIECVTPVSTKGRRVEWRSPVLAPSGQSFAATLQDCGLKPGLSLSLDSARVFAAPVGSLREERFDTFIRTGVRGLTLDMAEDGSLAIAARLYEVEKHLYLPALVSTASGIEMMRRNDALDPEKVVLKMERFSLSQDGKSMLATLYCCNAEGCVKKVVLFE